MSSTEAELYALAIELICMLGVLRSLGFESDEPIEIGTDNKGAYDLCHRFTSAQHSRHIDRKMYKMREMRGAALVTVKYVPTDDNTADLFTKILSRQVFEKHRKKVLNLPGDTCSESARKMRFLSDEQANCFADTEWSPLTAVAAGSQGGSVAGETRSRRRRSSRKGRMNPKHGTGLWYMEITMTVTYVYRGIAYTKIVK